MRTTRSTRSLAIAVGLVLLATGVASARPKVALLAFDGDAKGGAQAVVSSALNDDFDVVGAKQVNRTADKLGLDAADLGDKDLKKLSNELDADAIVQAKLSSKGGTHTLHFRLFVHGKKAKGFKIEYASLKSAKFKQKLHDKLVEKLGTDGEEVAPSPPPEPVRVKKKPPEDDDAKPAKGDGDGDEDTTKKKKPADDDDDHPHKTKKKHVAHAGDDGDDGDGVTAHVDLSGGAAAHSANRVAVRLDVGGSATERSLTFTSRSYPEAPKGYKNTPVPGARAEGELYPLAFGNPKSGIAGLGLGGFIDDTVVLNIQSTAQPGTKFPVTERRYGIGPRFRIVFGPKDTSPSLTLGIDYGHRTFQINRSSLMAGNVIDLPDVDYRGFTPQLLFRIPIVPKVALLFGGGAILLTGAGAIQTTAEYGQASVLGGQGMAGLDIVVTNRIAVRLVGEFAQLGFTFTGNGAQSNDRDMDPNTKDVGGAADRYIGGAATLAVLY